VFLAGQDRLVPGEPVVAETSPAHGDWDVDPGLREIRIRFDQPMDTSAWSVSGSTHYPEVTGEPYWADDRTFVLPVRVEPGRTYEVHINRAGGPRFRNAHGRAAPSAVIDFQTRAVR